MRHAELPVLKTRNCFCQVWEIYTNAGVPLRGMTSVQITLKLYRGEPVEHMKPERCPDNVWDCIRPCFEKEPADRPTYVECIH